MTVQTWEWGVFDPFGLAFEFFLSVLTFFSFFQVNHLIIQVSQSGVFNHNISVNYRFQLYRAPKQNSGHTNRYFLYLISIDKNQLFLILIK